MSVTHTCSVCNAAMPADAPEGLCPQCLLVHGQATTPPRTTPSFVGPFTPPEPSELAKQFPQLEIIELLGRGGMGAVYKARQPHLDRFIALKILPTDSARDPAFAERFAREARAMAKLNHPNIVQVFDFGQAANGLFYFLMEYVEGANLRQIIRGGKLQPAEALKIVPQICEALQFAHDEGIVHRDIKPENVLLDKRGRVKIADFGLAKLVGQTQHDYTLTSPWQIMGTLHYMAPEQMENPKGIDHRVDIFSLGVVFYELLTGQLPLGRFPPPSQKVQVDVRLDEVVLRALEREPEKRYQSASDIKTDVETISRSATLPPVTVMPAPTAGSATQVLSEPHPPTLPFITPTHLQEEQLNAAHERVAAPAVALLIVAILKIAGTLACLGYMAVAFSHTDVQRQMGSLPGGLLRSVTTVLAQSVSAPLESTAPLGMIILLVLGTIDGILGIFTLLGAIRLRQLRSPGMATTGAMLALAPLSPVALLGIPVGVWSLVALSKPGVRAAFGRRLALDRVNPRSPSDQVRGPAIGLVITGVLNCLAAVVVLGGLIAVLLIPETFGLSSSGHGRNMDWTKFFSVALGVIGLPSAVAGVLVLIGSIQLLRLQSSLWATIAAIAAMIPLNPAWLLGLPMGIWALLVKSRPELRRAFPEREKREPKMAGSAEEQVQTPSVALLLVGILNALAIVAAIICFFIYFQGAQAAVMKDGKLVPVGPPSEPSPSEITGTILWFVDALLGIPIIIGAIQMRRLKSHAMAVVASIIAMLPVSFVCLLGIPIGIWALRVLTRPEVRAAFSRRGQVEAEATSTSEPKKTPAKPPVGTQLLCIGIIIACFMSWGEASVSSGTTYLQANGFTYVKEKFPAIGPIQYGVSPMRKPLTGINSNVHFRGKDNREPPKLILDEKERRVEFDYRSGYWSATLWNGLVGAAALAILALTALRWAGVPISGFYIPLIAAYGALHTFLAVHAIAHEGQHDLAPILISAAFSILMLLWIAAPIIRYARASMQRPPQVAVRLPAVMLIMVGFAASFLSITGTGGLLFLLLFTNVPGKGELVFDTVFAGMLIAPSILVTVGGWRMLKLRSYGLAVTAAIFAIPLGVGIWALALLNKPETRAAFSSGTPPP